MIYDCFPFFNELMLLEIRLNEMSPFVDKFVLVEGTYTYSGQPKRLYYDEVKDNEVFAPFKDKITHLVYDGEPIPLIYKDDLYINPLSEVARRRRNYESLQRNVIEQGLSDAEPDDIIIGSDLDEIINMDVFPIIKNISKPCRLEMKLFYYSFNCRANENWYWAAFCRFRDFKTAQGLRLERNHKNIVMNAGWHFAELMSPDKLSEKLGSFCHAEYDTDHFRDVDRIRKHIEANEDIYERPNMTFTVEPLDAPKYVMNNQERYKEFIK